MKWLYFSVKNAIKTIQYSFPLCKNTGVSNLNGVGTLPSSDKFISSTVILVSHKVTTVRVGIPSLMVLIWMVTGIVSSFDLKNSSPLVRNTPVS